MCKILALLCLGMALVTASGVGAPQAGPYSLQWERSFGGSADDIILTADELPGGGFLLGGYSGANTNLNANRTSPSIGVRDAWMVRLDGAGNKLWDRAYGGTNINEFHCVERLADGGFIAAGLSTSPASGTKTSAHFGGEDFWVVRLDSNGNQLWDRSYGGTNDDFATVIRRTPDGGFLIGGTSFSGTNATKTSTNFGSRDFWVVRINADGDRLWDRSFGGTAWDELSALQMTSDGGFVLGGFSQSPASGNKTSAGFGNYDFWLVRVDASGNALWDRVYGGDSRDELRSLEPAGNGGFLIGGYSASGISGNRTAPNFGFSDYWIARLDAAGNVLTNGAAGGELFEGLWALRELSNGEIVAGGFSISGVSGNKTTPAYGGTDFWLVGFDSQIGKRWDATLGGSMGDDLYVLRSTSDGGLIAAGSSASAQGTGTKTALHFGGNDFWILKFALTSPRLRTVPQTQAEINQNGFRLFLSGSPNVTHVTESSPDLSVWTPISTNLLTVPEIEILDSGAIGGQRRFYRSRAAQ